MKKPGDVTHVHNQASWPVRFTPSRYSVSLNYLEGRLTFCVCRKCRSDARADGYTHEPYRRFLRQQRAARKRRRGWA